MHSFLKKTLWNSCLTAKSTIFARNNRTKNRYMDQTLIITVFVVVIVSVLAYKWKKKTENKMGNDLNALIGANDWRGVCRILRKQLFLWGFLLALVLALLIARIIRGEQYYTTIIVGAFIAWRFIKLVQLYRISHHNIKAVENCDDSIDEDLHQMSVENFLHGCKLTHIESVSPDKIIRLWQDAYKRGKRENFCPVILEVDSCFYDSLSDHAEWSDKVRFEEWQSKVLNSNLDNGKEILNERIERVRKEYDATEWENDVVGKEENTAAINHFEFSEGTLLYLVEVPVKEPWQVFAYIPMGGWNECPDAEEHMAIAKYWYQKYGAAVACISSDTIQYCLSQPIGGNTMPLAEEHLGYCEDILQGDNLTSLASLIKRSTIWYFWWD